MESRFSFAPGLFSAFLLVFLGVPGDVVAQTQIVDTCGQYVTGVAVLDGDLDCSGFDADAAVRVGRGGRLNLAGHTFTGNSTQPVVHCCEGAGPTCTNTKCAVSGPGTISGGTFGVFGSRPSVRSLTLDSAVQRGVRGVSGTKIRDCEITNSFYGVEAGKIAIRGSLVSGHRRGLVASSILKVRDSQILGNDEIGIQMGRANNTKRTNVTDSLVSGNGDFGISAVGSVTMRRSEVANGAGIGVEGSILKLIDSTITGNADVGVSNPGKDTFPTRLDGCMVTGNCLAPADVAACADVRVCTPRTPALKDTTCGMSANCADPPGNWGLCSLD